MQYTMSVRLFWDKVNRKEAKKERDEEASGQRSPAFAEERPWLTSFINRLKIVQQLMKVMGKCSAISYNIILMCSRVFTHSKCLSFQT